MKETSNLPPLFQGITPGQIFPILQQEVATADVEKLKDQLKDKLAQINFSFADNHPRAHLIFAVDVFDIQEYCFPLGFNKSIESLDLDTISKWLTGWYYFFEYPHRIFLMDEHRAELGNLRNRVLRNLKQNLDSYLEFEELVQSEYSKLDEQTLNEKQIEQLKNEILYDKLPWLIAAGTGELHNGPKRFQEVLKKLIINPEQGNYEIAAPWLKNNVREEHAEIIKEVFASTRPSKDAFARYLTSLDNFEEAEIGLTDRRRENLLADYNATDRIVEINKRFELLEKDLGVRYIVLYLSSDQKSHILAKEILDASPRMYGRPMPLMKNATHLWLEYWLCSKIQSDEPSAKINELNFDSIENLVLFYNTISQRTPLSDARMIERIRQLQERLQRYGLIRNAVSIADKLKGVFAELIQKSKFTPFKLALEELNATLNTTSGKEGLRQFQKELRSFSIQITVFQKIRTVLSYETTPDVSSLGYVVGINHHLPTLFAEIGSKSIYEELIAKTVKVILYPGKSENYSEELRVLSSELVTMLTTEEPMDVMDANINEEWQNLVNYYERQSLLYLFSLLLPASNLNRITIGSRIGVAVKSTNLDYEMSSLLEYDIKALLKVIAAKDSADNSKLTEEYRTKLKLIVSNLYYIQVWSLRRNNRLDECAVALQDFSAFSERQIENGEDVRIMHGTALLSYSRFFDLMNSRNLDSIDFCQADDYLKRLWKIAQKDVEKAVKAYERGNDMNFARIPFERAHSALVNSLIYTYVIGYALSKEHNRLLAARKLLDSNFKSFEEDRRKNPEYMHTEANLELFEAKYYVSTNKAKAKEKIGYALQTINQACMKHRQLFPHKTEDKDYIDLRTAIVDFDRSNFKD